MRHPRHSVARHRMRNRVNGESGWRRRKTILIAFALVLLGPVLLGGGAAFAVFHYYSSEYVPIEQVLVERPAGITRVYDRTGEHELGSLNNPASPIANPVALDDIATHLIHATVSTEDSSFMGHPGVNIRGLARAVRENYAGGSFGSGTGGSSITQQLVKNVYICPSFSDADDPCIAERTADRKLREMVYAIRLERDYSKEQILNWYLNQISYAGRYIGVEAAAQGYFRKSASQLTLAESALLAGIPASPGTYHPRLNCETGDDGECLTDDDGLITVGGDAKERQEYVLDLMVTNGYITPTAAEQAKAETIMVHPSSASIEQSSAAFIDNQVEPRLVRMCEAGELPMLRGAEDCETSVSSGGWSVVTTLDWEKTRQAQTMLQEWVERGLERGCDCHNAAMVTIEPDSGQLTVYVPNRDADETSDSRVAGGIDQLVEVNQPGSALKPAVYLAWFDLLDKTPASILWDTSPLELDPDEDVVDPGIEIVNPRPGGGGEGLITARSALGGSQNVPAFRAAQEVGTANFLDVAKKLGITTLEQHVDPTFLDHESSAYGPSIATGGANVRAVDMAFMNATLANMGTMVGLPHHATYIEDTSELLSILHTDGEDEDRANHQKHAFQRGHLRLPDTRPLDPVVILEVRDSAGRVIYEAPEPERIQVVEPASAWLLHTVMEDCEARWIIWNCGRSNDDTSLDVFVDGEKLPMGVKTGTQQGPLSIDDILASWVVGYSRHAATAVWLGNADKSLILDGSQVGYASSHTALGIYKNWMAEYHTALRAEGRVSEFLDFDDLQPANVTFGPFLTPTTERGHRGGCFQRINAWQRTDVDYESDCENGVVKLPDYKRDQAIDMARALGIPTSETRFVRPSQPSGSGNDDDEDTAPAPTPAPTQPAPDDDEPEPTPVPPTPTPQPEEPEPEPTPEPEPEPEPERQNPGRSINPSTQGNSQDDGDGGDGAPG